MAIGPGKYDTVCELARSVTGGSVLLIVFDGSKGDGFSMTSMMDRNLLAEVPEVLRRVAEQIEEDLGNLGIGNTDG